MFIQILSDLHTEFLIDYPGHLEIECARIAQAGANAEILVLAGDTGAPYLGNAFQRSGWEPAPQDFAGHYRRAIQLLSEHYERVILVAGNHEYYGCDIQLGNNFLCDIQDQFENVRVLNTTSYRYKGVYFLGATLWFNEKPDNIFYWRGMGDSQYNKTSLKELEELGEIQAELLAESLSNIALIDRSAPTMCISHISPTTRSIPREFRGSHLNRFYTNDLAFKYMEKEQKGNPLPKFPDVWVHGHTHSSFDYIMPFGTRIICNPFGYYGREGWNQNFEYDKIVEL